MTMRRLLTLFALSFLVLGATACKKSKDDAKASDDKAQAASAKDNAEASGDKADKSGDAVDVPKDGKKYEPAVAVSTLPEGAWHCNMNDKAHWAGMEKPKDGKCPVCGMMLHEAGN